MKVNQDDGTLKDEVQLTGSNAPLAATAPKLIGTINFGQFTASATLFAQLVAVLNRNAKQRSFIFYSSLNQPSSAAMTIIPYDSTLGYQSISGDNVTVPAFTSPDRKSFLSELHPSLSAHLDSIWLSIPMGVTAPTSGSIQIYVVEV